MSSSKKKLINLSPEAEAKLIKRLRFITDAINPKSNDWVLVNDPKKALSDRALVISAAINVVEGIVALRYASNASTSKRKIAAAMYSAAAFNSASQNIENVLNRHDKNHQTITFADMRRRESPIGAFQDSLEKMSRLTSGGPDVTYERPFEPTPTIPER